MINLMLVDDHPIVRTGLRALFENYEDISVLSEAGSGEEAVKLASQVPVDVVLCDLRLGDGMNGVATTAALRALPSPPQVLILTTFDKDAEILQCIEAGAAGYLLKDVASQTIIDSVRQAAAGHTVLAPEMAQRVVAGLRKPKIALTSREAEVLKHLATGLSNREIARTLFVSEATVKTHLVHIFDKLQAPTRTAAVQAARNHGLI
ncbi:response regulator transcription factor [Glutamicibacter sp. BW77]|uniref:Response regulator n=1 Tax=Glutamicibacter bergerei TaxID=256702 RepID=A0ABV9MSA3_9MICC|nr:response regulator transcription factor [Glutamicibacter sp. BW77]